MNATAPLPVTEQALERAGLRLDLAASVLNEVSARASDEDEFGNAEAEYLDAKRAFRAALSRFTGLSCETLERRLST